jgi:glycosyltransferase involved in cell wall biosynthesis
VTRRPAISVLMSVYNGERYLNQAIDSILEQSLGDFEFVIVDDGSWDRTPEILEGAQADPRLRVISQPNLGPSRALNVALAQAEGQFIARLDADDWSEPDRLEKQYAFLRQHPEVGLVGTACRVLDEFTGHRSIRRLPLADPELRRALVRYNPFVHSSVMMPRRVLQRVGGYNESFPVAIDYELWVRIACHACLANLSDVLTVKRVHRFAHFQRLYGKWEKCEAHLKIRWLAWRRFSRNVAELYFVAPEPIGRWLYARAKSI